MTDFLYDRPGECPICSGTIRPGTMIIEGEKVGYHVCLNCNWVSDSRVYERPVRRDGMGILGGVVGK